MCVKVKVLLLFFYVLRQCEWRINEKFLSMWQCNLSLSLIFEDRFAENGPFLSWFASPAQHLEANR